MFRNKRTCSGLKTECEKTRDEHEISDETAAVGYVHQVSASGRTFVTADWHLGETRLELMQRPFSTPAEMFDAIKQGVNSAVGPDDELIVVGDVCVDTDCLHLLDEINGQKALVRGNHDRRFTDDELARYFTRIVPEGEGIEKEVEGIPLWLTHYPTSSRADRFNLVGHIHSSWKVQLNMLNVGVDVHSFRPLPLEKVPFFLTAITDFYDADVWVADHPANAPFKNKRGRKSSYFTGDAVASPRLLERFRALFPAGRP